MKLFVVLMLIAVVAAKPKVHNKEEVFSEIDVFTAPENRNIIVNLFVQQFINYIRRIIQNGSVIFDIPPLDPLLLDEYHLNIPAGLLNLDIEVKNVEASGFGGFLVHKSDLNLSELSFDIDISVPKIYIASETYRVIGDFFTAIPLYGNGDVVFQLDDFRFRAKLYLKQSDDEESVLIDRIENASFEIPKFKSQLSGVIGGGDIDVIVNAIIEEVIFDYVNRFQGAISKLVSEVIVVVANPILDQLDTWRYIAILPRN